MSILITDDSVDSRMLLTSILAKAGHRDVVLAESAAAALDLVRRPGSTESANPIDLVIMDVTMPGMSGLDACRAMKSMDVMRDVPVIIVTGKTAEADLVAAFDAGASDYLSKPIRKMELLARVRACLALKDEMARRHAREKELLRLKHELETANAALLALATVDGLTGVANRRSLSSILDVEWRTAVRNGGALAILMIDIDHFKRFNDQHGHLRGDDCLRRVAATLASLARRPSDKVGRFGGEEFAVVLPNTLAAGAAMVAESMREAVEQLVFAGEDSTPGAAVTISIGVAAWRPSPVASVEDLIAAADRALYVAKASGRNRVHVG